MGLAVYEELAASQVLTDDSVRKLRQKEDLLSFPESASLTVRGYYDLLKAPVVWVWYNQLSTVNMAVACTAFSLKWDGKKKLAALTAHLRAEAEKALCGDSTETPE